MKTYLTALAALGALAASPACAQNMSVGVNVGTPGIGVQLSAKVSDLVVLRGAIDGVSISRDEDYSDIDYDGKAKLMTGGVFADLHPGGGAFFVSGGAYVGKRKINLRAQPTAAVDIGGQTFTPAQVGRLDGEAKLSNFQPFVGLGFDNTYVGERGWGFRALAGVAFSKRPDVNLTASGGTLSNDANFQARLRQEEAEARDDAKDFKYFPVVQVGLTRRF
ncbi:MAG: hypothetical protein JHD15_08880 [Phenylobacterium sp.]|uniref:hypothetical protein n=1 Tax=unclassified Phenylobacterium TaxID=2640670 RepID=UPI0008BD4837|nr:MULTISPECIES: hypothetical protein [unclassified Phenylobacterium]MBJ7410463.1 hypothetical protein [Phenylobacterium sp.]OHB28224.1 MAG: hypothetical protein A2790_11390 [Phenylobacterium sp. RIFCSPHIGHO2_01_FULL_69_31]